MTGNDYEFLLVHYFNSFDNASDDDLSMFIITAAGYLHFFSDLPTTIPTMLEKMISVAEIISRQQRRDTHRVKDAEDAAWINELSRVQDKLSEGGYAKLFRRLLHAFEKSYTSGVLVGDHGVIRRKLHGCLEAAHKGRTCEVLGCLWVVHSQLCFSSDCPLLPDIITTAPAALSAHEVLGPTPAPGAAYSPSLDPTRSAHETSVVRLHVEHLAPRSLSITWEDGPGTRDTFESQESAALDNPAEDHLSICSVNLKSRGVEQTAEDPVDNRTPPQARTTTADSTHPASVHASTVGSPGLWNADGLSQIMNADADHPARHDMPQCFLPRPAVVVDGSPQGERAASARRGEGSPAREAAVLFQGETGVNERGGETFELTRRDEITGEGG